MGRGRVAGRGDDAAPTLEGEVAPAAPRPHPARGGLGGLPPGRRLGDYRVAGLLGRGGMGAVYLAERVEAAAGGGPLRVALKVLPPAWLGEPERLERFRKEQTLLARLDHPNVVRGIGGLEQDPGTDLAYYAMELVLGSDLGALLRQHGRFPPAEVARIGAAVAAGLSAAHREQIVHRDVKPQNILLDRAGDVHLTDFGLARALDQSRLTRSGTALGTPSYMAPEQADGESLGPAADLYGLGVVLYELLVGRPPFEAESPIALLWQHRERTPPPVRARRPETPAALDVLVMRLLEKDPAARGETTEVQAALASIATDLEESAESGAFRQSVRTTVDDRTRSVIALRAPRRGDIAARGAPSASAAPASTALVPRRRRRLLVLGMGAAILLGVGFGAWRLRRQATQPSSAGSAAAAPGASPAPGGRSGAPAAASPAPAPAARLAAVTLRDGSEVTGRLRRYDPDGLWIEGADGALRRIPLSGVRTYRLSAPAPPSGGP